MKSKIYQTKLTAKGLLATCLTPLELCKQPAPGSEMKKLIILLALFAAYLVPVNYAGAQIPCNWATDTVYPIPILDQATVTLGTNLYSFAGASNNVVTASSYKFNGSIWTPIAPLPAALEFPRAVTDGTDIYILGGFSSNTSTAQTSVYRYNVGSDSYTTLAPFTTGVWNESVVYLNGKIYKFCGTSLSSASTSVLEIYDIAGNSWTTGAPYPIALSYVSAIAEGNFIYAGGGLAAPATTPTLKTYRYDPGTDTWDDASIADLPQTRWGAAEAFYNTGFLMAGGYLNGTTTANISNSAISWDIATNTWITLPNMIGERARMTGAVLNGSFYVIGGRSIASSAFVGTNSNQQYSCCTVVPSITGDTIFCSGSSTILDAGLYTGYNWSTGATTQTISVNTAGTFTVSVTNGSGCTGSTSVTTTVNANPAPVISGSTSFCTGSSTTLDAGGGYTNYNWSTGATTQTITVSTTGTFTVTVTNGNGCTGTASTTTMVNPSPDVSVPADTTICNGTLLPMGTFNFSATGFDGKILIAYADVAGPPTQLRNALLSTPGVIQVDLFDASAGIPALTLMQQYHIVVPFSNNPYSDPVALGNNLADYVDSNGTVVGIGFTFYNSPYGPSGRWITGNYSPYIPGSGLEATTRTLGTFTSGHPLMAGVSVLTSNYHNVVPVAGGATEVAQWNNGHSLIAFKGRVVGITAYIGSQATWSGDFAKVIVNAGTWLNGNATISWTNNNTTIGLGASGTGSSLPTFTATNNTATSVTATITVTASNTNAGVTCTGSETFTITVNPSPDPIISGNLSFCAGSSTTLNAGAGYSGYNWSTGATTQTISVNTPGAFTVTVTDGSGCTGSDSATVTMNLPPPCLITGNGFFCPGSSLQLCAATNSSYLWSTGATTQCILVSTAGTYTVTVTNASGCTSSCSKTVFTYTAIPYTLTGSNFCSGDSTELCFVIIPSFGGNGYSLIWSTGATTDCIKTATGGTYTVTVTDQNGCTSSASITV
ncbi:MAG: kelch repeat-containing protein, partial [Bacteroidia bacterium]